MSSRKENERVKYIQEKCQTLLSGMLRDEDNKYCVDCDAKGPRWASFNLGVFLCIRCAGIHRNLGVHISRVKSVNLDSWTPDQVVSLQQMGNSRARAVYEAQLPDGFRRPQTDSALESFIRAKYEHKKYMAREWVPPPPPKANWDKEVDDELEKQKRKKKSTISTNLGLSVTNNDKKITSANTAKIPIPAPLPKPKVISGSPKSSNRHNQQQNAKITTDLLNLDNLSPAENRINSGDDIFSNFLSASSVTPTATNTIQNSIQQLENEHKSAIAITTTSTATNNENFLAKEEQDFFNQVPTESEKLKLTKDGIMALYDTEPSGNNNFNSSSIHSTTNAMFVPQQMSNYSGIHQQQYINNNNNSSNNNSSQLIGLNNNQQQTFGAIPLSHNPTLIGNSFPSPIQTYSFGSLSTQPFVQSGMQLPAQQQQLPNNTGNNSQSNNVTQQFGNLNLGNVWQ